MGAIQNLKKLFAQESTVKIKAPKGKDLIREIGRSGTKLYSGYLSGDFNYEFQGQNKITIYDKMMRTDAMVNATTESIKLPILSTEWRIENAVDDPGDAKKLGEFVRLAFNKMDRDFHDWLYEALDYVFFGFYYFEKVFKIEDGKIFWDRWASRVPTAHEKWEMASSPDVPGITQTLPASKYPGTESIDIQPEIPMSKLILLTHRKHGDDYEGISVLRSAYKHFHYKDVLYRLDAIRAERGAGVLHIGLPESASDEDMTDAVELAENFRANEKNYIITPTPDWKVELLNTGVSGSSQTSGIAPQVEHHNLMLAMNVLAQFLALGTGGVGSYSLSKDQSSFFTLGLQSITRYIENQINKQAIKELIDLNFGKQENYPRLVFSDVGEVDFTELTQTLAILAQAGAVEIDNQMKVWVRKQMGYPEITLEELERQEQEKEKNAQEKLKKKEEEEKIIPEVKEVVEETEMAEIQKLLTELEHLKQESNYLSEALNVN